MIHIKATREQIDKIMLEYIFLCGNNEIEPVWAAFNNRCKEAHNLRITEKDSDGLTDYNDYSEGTTYRSIFTFDTEAEAIMFKLKFGL